MSNANTSAVKSVKVMSDATAADLDDLMRKVHGKVMKGLQECDIKPLFNDMWEKCTTEDYKALDQQRRAMMSAKRTAVWEINISSVREKIAALISTHMERKARSLAVLRAEGLEEDFTPVVWIKTTDMAACWPQGTDMSQVHKDLLGLGYEPDARGKKDKNAPMYVKVVYKEPEAPKVEAAPTSTDKVVEAPAQDIAAAAE